MTEGGREGGRRVGEAYGLQCVAMAARVLFHRVLKLAADVCMYTAVADYVCALDTK